MLRHGLQRVAVVLQLLKVVGEGVLVRRVVKCLDKGAHVRNQRGHLQPAESLDAGKVEFVAEGVSHKRNEAIDDGCGRLLALH